MNNFDPSQAQVQVNAQALLAALAMVQPQLQAQMQASGGPQWQGQYWQQQPQQSQQPQPQQGASGAQQAGMPQWPPMLQGQTVAQPANSNEGANLFLLNWQQQQQQLAQLQQAQFAAQQTQQPPALPRQQADQTPVGTLLDDETRLLGALKKCKASGLTPRQAIENLDGVNNHSAAAWKDYFLDNLHRLYALSNPRPDSTTEAPVASSNGASSSHGAGKGRARAPELPKARPRLPDLPRRGPSPRRASPERLSSSQNRSRPSKVAPPKAVKRQRTATESRPVLPTGTQRRRYSPVPIFHAGVRVPNSSPTTKPTPPPHGGGGGESKLTDEHKIYFIHYLRWRLNKSPTIARPVVYEELEKETHYSADVWRVHWDKYPETPDQVCIEAYNRAVPASQPVRTTSVAGPSRASRESQPLGSKDGNSSSDGDSDSESSSSEPDDDAPLRPSAPRGRPRKRVPVRVTEEDLRAMAKYKVANYNTWNRKSRMERWREFAERPENRKRSLEGWYTIGESSHTQQLEEYFQQCAQEEHMLVRMSEGSVSSKNNSALFSSASPSTAQERSPTLVDVEPSSMQEYEDALRKRGSAALEDKAPSSKRAREESSD
ncbi:hypothetical protein C8Q79DRAFT_943258 [Trametes meyenii]|nr:hypothetical protein C8Q79DRAFT_943258 [Trametes meyenii]